MQKEIPEKEKLFFASNTLEANLNEKGITARERQMILKNAVSPIQKACK